MTINYKISLKKVSIITLNILLWGGIALLLIVIGQIFLFSSFKIPSDSMEPELEIGDNILVYKPVFGPRLFNIFASMRGEQMEIYRIPGLRNIERNDVLVFNFPHPNNWKKIEIHILKYYIKRCVGLPGDTLLIVNGIFQIKGIDYPIGNEISQQQIAQKNNKYFQEIAFHGFPYDSILHWNIKDFGPLYIPKKNGCVKMDRTNYCLYKKVIEWEQKVELSYKDSLVYLDNKVLDKYQFQKNYYFMAGDNLENSQDSRYWGLLPEDYIVGKAWVIWKSENPYTGRFRRNRFMKIIH